MKIRHHILMFLLPHLLRLLPMHGRRIVIVIMMYRTLIHVGYAQRQELETLNRYLNLATDVQSLQLPLRLSKYIWSDHRLDGVHFNDWWQYNHMKLSPASLAIGMVRYIPPSLRYSSNEVMIDDMHTLLDINNWTSGIKPEGS